jgi:hypothetical protein
MERRFRRKIWRIEKQISEVKTRKEEEWHDPKLAFQVQFHTAEVAAIVLEGEPKIDEPLIRARERAWERFGLSGFPQEGGEPFAKHILLIEIISGKDETETFSRIFEQAPPWLLQFTTIALDALLLKFQLPDLSAPAKWGRDGIKDARRWPLLPLGMITAGEPVTEQIVVEPRRLSADDCRFIAQLRNNPEEGQSGAEGDRHDKIWNRLQRRKDDAPIVEDPAPLN